MLASNYLAGVLIPRPAGEGKKEREDDSYAETAPMNIPSPIRDWKGLLRQSLSSMSSELKYLWLRISSRKQIAALSNRACHVVYKMTKIERCGIEYFRSGIEIIDQVICHSSGAAC